MVGTVPVEVLRGLYLGILTGVVPGLIAFGFGFGFRYVTGVTVPSFAVVVLGLALAGVNGGLLALADPAITQQANSVTLMTAVVVVSMIALYAHAKGDQLGADAPRRLSWRTIRDRTVSNEVVEFVAGGNRVTVEVVGSVRDMEGYPPLPEDLRRSLEEVSWRFPADLTLGELERRMADRLKSEFDLQEVAATIDQQGRASVAAAPPTAGVSSRVEAGRRAVSVSAVVPTGVARGDRCTVLAGDRAIQGTVVSARSDPGVESDRQSAESRDALGRTPQADPALGQPQAADEDEEGTDAIEHAPTTTGGEGRVTVSVPIPDAKALLGTESAPIVIESRGTRREYELISLLRQAGQQIRRVSIESPGPFADRALAEAGIRESFDVAVLAHRHERTWTMGPAGETTVATGDEVFVVGDREGLQAFSEAVA